MPGHPDIYAPALIATIATLTLWVWLSRRLTARGRTRWRAVPLCLPLLLIAMGYGFYWFGFFQSPATAVQLHAIRLTVSHAVDGFASYMVGGWLAVSLLLLLPVFRPRKVH